MIVPLAVSGTIEEGFELRRNIDAESWEAVFLGPALCRGAKMYLDIKETGCREHDRVNPARVNPAMVLTGDERDANVYSVYLVEERACVSALLGEPRLLSMAADALRVDLEDPLTSPRVVEFARAKLGYDAETCAVLSVVAAYRGRRFVAAPPFEIRSDGTRVTSFRRSLAIFSGIDQAVPGSSSWNQAVAAALVRANAELPADSEALYATNRVQNRLSTRLSVEEIRVLFSRAGLGDIPALPEPLRVRADPYPFPLVGSLDPETTALLIVDLQRDFTEEGGYASAMGLDLKPLAAPLANVKRVLAAARSSGLKIIHTRQGFRDDLADVPPHVAARFAKHCDILIGKTVGPLGTVFIRGQPGWHINDAVAPIEGEPVVDKTANSAFVGTDLDRILRASNIHNLVLCGNTLDVCVHSTMRHANDLNYHTCLLEDCCGCAAEALKKAMLHSVKIETGVFGCVSNADAFISALHAMPPPLASLLSSRRGSFRLALSDSELV
ncbi:hypothetical protein CTAYLR_001883 [Chrysophaeum taylorii]|uniref:Isochorismatase-like domain-containing protein n=1 Tax=Chrysophaeum taylorii TaxID=2483200 RepID=A0AAD7U8V4_9STRA|nr:hypothetical protein CTAYLR_001883 [Chrysophaeum taylorii]